jgi:hypothetical protein
VKKIKLLTTPPEDHIGNPTVDVIIRKFIPQYLSSVHSDDFIVFFEMCRFRDDDGDDPLRIEIEAHEFIATLNDILLSQFFEYISPRTFSPEPSLAADALSELLTAINCIGTNGILTEEHKMNIRTLVAACVTELYAH